MANSDNPQAAFRLAKSLATERPNKELSVDKQIAGEAAARAGQVIGTYFGGVGGFVGKRIGRVLGENWRIILFISLFVVGIPLFFLALAVVSSISFWLDSVV